MKETDWIKLCKIIHEQNCILFLGPEFPVEVIDNNGKPQPTTLSKLLAERISPELKGGDATQRELYQVTMDYLASMGKTAREDLEILVPQFYESLHEKVSSPSFDLIAEMPFPIIINTDYGDFFYKKLGSPNKSGAAAKKPWKEYYDFKGPAIDSLRRSNDEHILSNIGNEMSPFVYNLFGSIQETRSLAISEYNLIELLCNIIAKNPPIPVNLKSELADGKKSFLFLGFGFIARNWYFRILLHVLESANKQKMSYALECIDNIEDSQKPTVAFFQRALNLSLYHYDQQEFIRELSQRYKKYKETLDEQPHDIKVPAGAPTAFISYKSEDAEKARMIYDALRKNGINAWLDKKRISGEWRDSIADAIDNSDAFVLVQSQNLTNVPVNYVNVEIKKATRRAEYFKRASDFLFPVRVDNSDSMITEPPVFREIHSLDLMDSVNLDRLSIEIKMSYERNKRR